jgi:hypothetical protein
MSNVTIDNALFGGRGFLLRLAFDLFGNEDAEMAKFVAVSREAHAQKVWRRFANYQFAAKNPGGPDS